MREIDTHKINELNTAITVTAIDTPAGEPALYKVAIPDAPDVMLRFQLGPIAEVGINGITNEILLAIVLDRLGWFQRGPFSCRENAIAYTKLEEALLWLHSRTRRRVARGVEGTHNV